jgi:hypothetical protein
MKTQSESKRKFRMSVWERRNAARPTAGMALRSEALKKADRSFAYSPMARVLVWVVLLGAAARLAHGLICAPGVHPDTPDYVELARRIAAVNFAGWDGWRTPVFPLLLLLCRFDFSAVRLVQSLLGIATAAIISVLIFQRTGSSMLALLGGLAYAFDLGQISFESLVMTGALCTFLVVASVLIFARIVLAHPGGRAAGAGWHVVLGFVAGAAALTRPLFLFLAPLYLIALLSIGRRRGTLREHSKGLGALAAPASALIFGWCLFNWFTAGYLGPTSTTGFTLSYQSGRFISLAPDKYAAIREPYIRAMKQEIAATGKYGDSDTIFLAAPEIYRKTGWTKVQLSRELTAMSLEMFAEHPLLYARGVWRAWMRFWEPRGEWDPEQFSDWRQRIFLKRLWALERLPLIAVNLLFLFAAARWLIQWILHRRPWDFDLSLASVVLAASLVQAAMELGANSRFSVPTVPLVICVAMIAMWEASQARWDRAASGRQQSAARTRDGVGQPP